MLSTMSECPDTLLCCAEPHHTHGRQLRGGQQATRHPGRPLRLQHSGVLPHLRGSGKHHLLTEAAAVDNVR